MSIAPGASGVTAARDAANAAEPDAFGLPIEATEAETVQFLQGNRHNLAQAAKLISCASGLIAHPRTTDAGRFWGYLILAEVSRNNRADLLQGMVYAKAARNWVSGLVHQEREEVREIEQLRLYIQVGCLAADMERLLQQPDAAHRRLVHLRAEARNDAHLASWVELHLGRLYLTAGLEPHSGPDPESAAEQFAKAYALLNQETADPYQLAYTWAHDLLGDLERGDGASAVSSTHTLRGYLEEHKVDYPQVTTVVDHVWAITTPIHSEGAIAARGFSPFACSMLMLGELNLI